MMIRKEYASLLNWKNKKVRNPLMVLGVRQCGKTYLIKEFGKQEFEDIAYCNFDGNKGLQSIFDYDPACRGAQAYIQLAIEFLSRRGADPEAYQEFKMTGGTPVNYDFGG